MGKTRSAPKLYYDILVTSYAQLKRCEMEAEAHMHWESETRYYTVVLHRDLLEDWVLTIAHGGRG